MTPSPPGTREDAPPAGSRTSQLMEQYGTAAIVTMLGLLALQLAVLTPLLHYGVDLSGFARWIAATFGVEVDVSPSGGWMASLVAAYLVTRALKWISLPLALGLTPLVARITGLGPRPPG